MSNQNNGNGGLVSEWEGFQRFENYPVLAFQLLRVTRENGKKCSGGLTVLDGASQSVQKYSWEAVYFDNEHWQIAGRIAGESPSASFSPRPDINHEITTFVQDRLNGMRRDGTIFRSKPCQTRNPTPSASLPLVPEKTEAAKDLQPTAEPAVSVLMGLSPKAILIKI